MPTSWCRKSATDGETVLPREIDEVKAESAAIFYELYVTAREDPEYKLLKREHQRKYG